MATKASDAMPPKYRCKGFFVGKLVEPVEPVALLYLTVELAGLAAWALLEYANCLLRAPLPLMLQTLPR